MLGECLTADVRENDELHQAELVHCLHLRQQRITRSHQRLVIKGLLQPPPDRFQAAEVHHPAPRVERVGFELQVHSERVAVKEPAVR
ncbi:hypothetical protein Mext_0079 [Methylorubrum extorquens PA1]|nr:hypothetical protein Mext_0079 [Methylorubrum extorquens PA1]